MAFTAPVRNGHRARFNVTTMKVEDGGDEVTTRWLTSQQVIALLLQMNEGDELHIQHAAMVKPGVIYP